MTKTRHLHWYSRWYIYWYPVSIYHIEHIFSVQKVNTNIRVTIQVGMAITNHTAVRLDLKSPSVAKSVCENKSFLQTGMVLQKLNTVETTMIPNCGSLYFLRFKHESVNPYWSNYWHSSICIFNVGTIKDIQFIFEVPNCGTYPLMTMYYSSPNMETSKIFKYLGGSSGKPPVNRYSLWHDAKCIFSFHESKTYPRELTYHNIHIYPAIEKGKSSSQVPWDGICDRFQEGKWETPGHEIVK